MDALGTGFDALLTRGALCALGCAALWATLVVATVAVEAWTRGRIRLAHRTGCPVAWRTWLLGLLVVLFAGAAPATAGERPGPGRADGPAIAALDGLPLPDRVAGAPVTTAPHRRGGPAVVVQPGDSLWRIARRMLPADAPDSTVAAVVETLHAHNRRTIGADPDLIRPGQRLGVPARALLVFPTLDPTTLSEAP
jgi:hypothetical protein